MSKILLAALALGALLIGPAAAGCSYGDAGNPTQVTTGTEVTAESSDGEVAGSAGGKGQTTQSGADQPPNEVESNGKPEGPGRPGGDDAEELTLLAKSDLAQKLGIAIDEIEMRSMTEVEWNDTSLGCPQEDMSYAQVITPGSTILLEVDGQTYEYHTDKRQRVVLCTDIVKTTPPPFR